METAPGARGIVIGDRYRVAGALRRDGLVDAIDSEATPTAAACRIALITGDADAWEDAWREAQDAAPLPRLIETVAHDGGEWAVVEASMAVGPATAAVGAQARAAGAALAAAGLDVRQVTAAMLAADAQGDLVLDTVIGLGGAQSPRAAGRALAALLEPEAVPRPPAPRRRPRRLLVPVAILLALGAAAIALAVPARSEQPVPRAPATAPDVLLGAVAAPAVPASVPRRRQRPRRQPQSVSVPEPAATPAPVVPVLPRADPVLPAGAAG